MARRYRNRVLVPHSYSWMFTFDYHSKNLSDEPLVEQKAYACPPANDESFATADERVECGRRQPGGGTPASGPAPLRAADGCFAGGGPHERADAPSPAHRALARSAPPRGRRQVRSHLASTRHRPRERFDRTLCLLFNEYPFVWLRM